MNNSNLWKVQNRYFLNTHFSTDALNRIKAGSSVSKELGLTSHLTNYPMEMEITFVDNPGLFPNLAMCIRIAKVAYDFDKTPVEYSETFIHPQYYSLNISSE